MSELTAQQREQYFRVRLDPYRLRHSKAMEHRSRCPLHDGSNPSQFWVDLKFKVNNGWFKHVCDDVSLS